LVDAGGVTASWLAVRASSRRPASASRFERWFYFVLEADAGLGKTTFCAWLARNRGYPHHFVRIFGRPGSARTPRCPACGAAARALRLADGPDEVHRRSLARTELARHSNVPDVGPDEPPSERIQEN